MNPTDDHQDPVPPPALSERIKALGDKGVPPISGAIGRDIAKIRGLIGPDLKIRGLAGSNLTAGAIKSVLDSSIVGPKGAELTKIMGNLAANSAQAAERRAVDYNAIASRVRLPSPEVQALQTMVTQAEEQSDALGLVVEIAKTQQQLLNDILVVTRDSQRRNTVLTIAVGILGAVLGAIIGAVLTTVL